MIRTFFIALVVLMFAAEPARAEPISAIIGLTALLQGVFGTGALLTIGAWSLTASTLGGMIVGVGLSVGLSIAANALRKRTATAADQNAGKFNERQPIPSKRIIVGKTRHGGALFFEECKPPYLYMGFLLNEGRIDAVEKVWIGTNEVPFSSITEGVILTPSPNIDGPAYETRLRVSFGYGADDQGVDAIIADAFASIGSEFRQRGVARAVLRCHWGSDQDEYTSLWGQVQRPSPYFLSRGIRVWDPRDPTQDVDDPDTWQWSDNPTLIIFDYARAEYGGRLYLDDYDWDIDKICESADWDDSIVGTASGEFIKRYTCNGMYMLNQGPDQVLKSLMSSNRSKLIDRGGKLWIDSAKPKTPVATIHDGILVGGFEYSAARPKRDMINRMKTRFVANDREYEVVDGPVYQDADMLAEDGEYLDGTIDLPFTDDHRIAQRLAKINVAESRLGKSLPCRCDISLLAMCSDELIGNPITFNSNLFPQANGTYLVTKMTLSDAVIDLDLAEYDPSIETDWNPAADEQEFTLPELDVS